MAPARPAVVNAMTVDVEDYFHVSAFEHLVSRDQWDTFESRVVDRTLEIVDLFAETGVKATFFVLGWVADRFPALVRHIAEAGHEIASHSYAHRLVYEMTPDEFRDDLRRARIAIEDAAGVPVRGFRAPSYSIISRSMWAFDVLLEEGYLFDASIFPVHHDRYGLPLAPRHPFAVERFGAWLWEVPTATVAFGSQNLPVGGGGYFRLLPYRWTRWGFDRLNRVEGRPAVFYIHPWELDAGQPRLPVGLLTRVRHYRNLDRTAERLRRLVREFPFDTVTAMLDRLAAPALVAA